jgi:t-SNARE complex subunit (syntaxin)
MVGGLAMNDFDWINEKLDQLENDVEQLGKDVTNLENRFYKLQETILMRQIEEFLDFQ